MSSIWNDLRSITAGVVDDDIEDGRLPTGRIIEAMGDMRAIEHRVAGAQLVDSICKMETKRSGSDGQRLFDAGTVCREVPELSPGGRTLTQKSTVPPLSMAGESDRRSNPVVGTRKTG
jgi:hypothetical protein